VKNCLSTFPYAWLDTDDDDFLDFDLDDFDDDDLDDFDVFTDDDDDDLDDFTDDDDDDLDDFTDDFDDAADFFILSIMSMSIMKQFISGNSGYYLMTATILILRHATTLRISGLDSKSALAQAELDYQKLNISWKITQNFPQQYSIPNFVDFIMGVSF